MSRGKLLAAVSLSICLMLPAFAYPDVRIILKNGRSFTAESCREKGDGLECWKAGGVFSVDKGDIDKIEGSPAGRSVAEDKELMKGPSDGSLRGGAAVEKGGEPQESTDSGEVLKEKLGEITQKKKALQKERAELVKDRQKLNADIDKAPDWMTEIQYAELSGRAAQLDKRIKRYNEELSRLDKREKEIIDQLEGKTGKEVKEPKQD